MYKYIQNIKEKDESVRKKVVMKWMALSVLVVVFAWVMTISSRFNNDIVVMDESKEDEPKPLQMFKDSISVAYRSLSASAGNIPKFKEIKNEINREEKMINLTPVEYTN